MGRLYDAYVEVGPRFAGFGDIKRQGDQAGKQYGKALADAAVKAAQANVRRLGEALAKARGAEADAAGKVRVAEAKLNEVRQNSKASLSAIVSAEEALAAAQRKSAASSNTARAASEALQKAQKQVADSAESAAKLGGGRFSSAFKNALSKIGGDKEGKAVATRFGVGFNGAFGGIVSRSAGIFAAGFAAIKSTQVFAGFIKDAADSARVGRLTEAVIKSTGGAAKVTAGQVGDLATAISNKTGADDETIQSGANMLLTFTNIRNAAGKNNDIFNQATQTVTDLAAAMNNGAVTQDGVKTASIQLGKALNDPVKGITALQKVGVSFTADQKSQIQTLVKNGQTMQAQKIILGELSKEFGGAAAAAGDPFTRLSTIFGNLGEELGGYLLPYANKFANFVSDKLIPGVSGLVAILAKGDFTSGLRQAFGVSEDSGFVDFLLKVHGAAVSAFTYFKAVVLPRLQQFGGYLISTVVPAVASFITQVVSALTPALTTAFGFFKTNVLPALQSFASFLSDKVLPPVADFASKILASKDFMLPFAGVILGVVAALKAWSIAQGILNVVLAANPIGLVVVAIAGLVAGLVYAYKHSEKFRDIVNGAFGAVKGFIVGAIGVIQKTVQTFAPLVKAAVDIVIGVFSLWWNSYAKPILTGFGIALAGAWKLSQKFSGFVIAAFNAIKNPAFTAIRFVINNFLTMVSVLLSGAAKAFGWVPGMGPKLKAAAKEFGKFRDNVNTALAGVQDQQINFTIKYSNTGVNLSTPSSVGRRATGGAIHGPGTGTSDTAGLYALSNGEHVWTAKEVSAAGGHAAMEQMRKSVVSGRGFAKGGAVGLNPHIVANASGLAKSVKDVVVAAASSAAKALAKSGGGLAGTMAFGRSQAGKPYIWGAAGPNGYDCSGYVGALINYAKGRNPFHRLGATGSMPWSDMAPGTGPFMVGWFKGNPGHTAATINGVNFESRGGRGVVVGSAARGAYDGLFTNRAKVRGFAKGGAVKGDPPFDILDRRGKAFGGSDLLREFGIGSYAGGSWQIPTDQLALVHRNEMIVPAKYAGALRGFSAAARVRNRLHALHEQHQAHVAHVAHVNHANRDARFANLSRVANRGTLGGDFGSGLQTRIHPDDIRAIGLVTADALKSSPLRIDVDGRSLDTALSNSAISRGYR